jgi:EAL domain-containing protein (putative c-di-GMP-specific phosphodiesterase class I)
MYSPWEIPFKISVSPTHTLSAFFHENIYWLLSLLLFVFALFFVLRGCEKNKQKHSLMKGIKNNEFVPYYQPVVNICDNSIIGVEILARWQHPTQGLVLPSGFIEKVEYYGLTEEMTLSLLLQVEKDILNINAFDQKGFHVAVNVTPPSLNEEWFLRKLTQFIKNMNSIRVSVIIEITERQRAKVNVSSLSKLRQEGAILALDDFGTGYSNYCNISELSPDYLKIDKSFVAEAGNETVNGKIFSNIIGLSKSTCIPLIAEGVENECQLKNILKAGVTFAQGYLFSRPVDVEKFVSLYTLNREKK